MIIKFKYLNILTKNSTILSIISFFSLVLGILIIFIFYNFSSNLKNVYLELKSKYSSDDKYLAVITKNGLWIKDRIDGKINIINAERIDNKYLVDTFITQFDEDYEILKNVYSKKINIEKKNGLLKVLKFLKII